MSGSPVNYEGFSSLAIEIEDGRALVTMQFTGGDQATRSAQQADLGQVWRVLDRDPGVRSVVITGTGDEFYLSGRPPGSPDRLAAGRDPAKIWPFTMKIEHELSARIHEMIHFSKPVVAAINGGTAGAGLGVALLSDITIAAEDAYFFDPHMLLGMAAGDGPPAVWPLLTGLAKASRASSCSRPRWTTVGASRPRRRSRCDLRNARSTSGSDSRRSSRTTCRSRSRRSPSTAASGRALPIRSGPRGSCLEPSGYIVNRCRH
jgi:hypothetical protein